MQHSDRTLVIHSGCLEAKERKMKGYMYVAATGNWTQLHVSRTPRTPWLCTQCSANELRQPDNHQPSQSSMYTAQMVWYWNAPVAAQARHPGFDSQWLYQHFHVLKASKSLYFQQDDYRSVIHFSFSPQISSTVPLLLIPNPSSHLHLLPSPSPQKREDRCHVVATICTLWLHSKGKNRECKLQGWVYGQRRLVFSTKLSHLGSQNGSPRRLSL